MFNDLRPYDDVQTTNLPWVTTLPSHWNIQRAKSVMRSVDIRSGSGEEELLTVSSHRGVVPRSSASVSMFQAASYAGHKLCWPDDLVINSLWAWGRGLGVSRHHGIVSAAYGVYRQRPNAQLLSGYLHHLVRSAPFQWELQVRSYGVWRSRLQITDARWLDTPLLLPPRAEQAAIIKYLTHANARIDKAIVAKRRLIGLLEEQKTAAAAAVIGAPAGRHVRLKNVATIQTGLTLGKEYRDQELIEYPYLRVANVQMGHVDTGDVAVVAVPLHESERCTLRPGDVLMTEGGDIDKLGRGTVWRGEVEPCLHQNHVFAVRCGEELQPDYLAAWLAASIARQYFYVTAKKTTNLAATNSSTVRELPITLPSVDGQWRLLELLARKVRPMDDAISRASKEVDLLREFLTRLVADVVTGQVDVREISKSLSATDATASWDDEGVVDTASAGGDEVFEAS